MTLFFLRCQKFFYCFLRPRFLTALWYNVLPSFEHKAVIQQCFFDHVLDVGANRGQFSLFVNSLFPSIPVYAYEPLSCEADKFQRIHFLMDEVRLHRIALGSKIDETEFHISKSADSSSILPIGRLQEYLFPATKHASTCRVRVAPLDSFPDHWKKASRAFLKIDVQGYELEVLRGAVQALKHCAYVYVECSEVPLYDGQALRPAVQEFLEQHGFCHRSRQNETYDAQGTLIQADHLFERIAG